MPAHREFNLKDNITKYIPLILKFLQILCINSNFFLKHIITFDCLKKTSHIGLLVLEPAVINDFLGQNHAQI